MPKKIVYRKTNTGTWVEDYFNSAKNSIKDLTLPLNLELKPQENLLDEMKNYLAQFKRPYVMFNPAGINDKRRQGRIWNIDKWRELSKEILKDYQGTIFVNGCLQESEHHLKLKEENVEIISGKFSLLETCALISLMDLVISGDSGPLHISSALNVNTLAILGSTSPDKIRPYGQKGFFVEPENDCRYCWAKKCKFLKEGEIYTPCIESISVKKVIEKIKDNKLL